MLRHSSNSNLTLYTNSQYAGLPVQSSAGPLIEQYLFRIMQVAVLALNQHPRTFVFRCDLRFPATGACDQMNDNCVIERFMASFKAKLRHNRDKARLVNPHAHDSAVRYIWCREYGRTGTPHYHCVFFLNNDAFHTLGRFVPGRDNLFNRLQGAWASALGMDMDGVNGLVEIPSGACWQLPGDNPAVWNDFFYRVSYLAKAQTKHYSLGLHAFGSSRG